jgi:hypothetical protein
MKKDSEPFFQELKDDVTIYIELKFELLKLSAYERTGKVVSVLSYGLILLVLGFFLILFLLIALGFFLSDWFESMGIGFSIVAGLALLLLGGVFLFKDKIRRHILNIVIAALTEENKEDDAAEE